MAHVVIKNNAQPKPVTTATNKGKILSGQPHIAKHKVGSKKMNKVY